MRIAVFGLGYVGCVSAACFAARGHDVVGVEINPLKRELINGGKSPVLEPALTQLVADVVAQGRLRATDAAGEAVRNADLSLVCVGTPSRANGSLGTEALERAISSIGAALPLTTGRHTVVVRSTMVPGTSEHIVVPLLETTSGRRAGTDFGVAVNPEFLREGSSIADFDDPPKTVIGELDAASGDAVASLYDEIRAPLFRVPIGIAEMVKYVDNAFHALKVGFANEIGLACREFGLDSHEVMRIFCADRKLNISPAYLTPGFAFGGSCLPKDLRALLHATRRADLTLPILEAVLPSNDRHLQAIVDAVVHVGRRRVGIFGLAFKPLTDDLRESPLVELSERLLGKGFDLRIYDPEVSLSRLVGANREYVENRLPHLSALLVPDAASLVEHAEVCIVGARTAESVDALKHADGRHVIDLVRLPDASERRGREEYTGVAW